MKGIWAGFDRTQKSCHRIIPFTKRPTEEGDEFTFHPTVLCTRVEVFEGCFPLHSDYDAEEPEYAEESQAPMLTDKEVEEHFPAIEDEDSDEERFDVDRIIRRGAKDATGEYRYQLGFKGYPDDADETPTWRTRKTEPSLIKLMLRTRNFVCLLVCGSVHCMVPT